MYFMESYFSWPQIISKRRIIEIDIYLRRPASEYSCSSLSFRVLTGVEKSGIHWDIHCVQ